MHDLLLNEKVRSWLVQAVALGLVVALLAFFVTTAHRNLVDQGIASGFGFLFRTTGWDIPFSLIDYSIRDPYWRVLLIGFQNTLFVGLFSIALATVFGTLIGIARISNNLILSLLATSYVEVFRNVPLILQGFFWYAVMTHLPPPKKAYELWDMVFLTSRGLYIPWVSLSDGQILFLLALVAVAVVLIWGLIKLPVVAAAPRRKGLVFLAVALATAGLAALALMTGREAGAGLIEAPVLKGLRFKGGLRIMPEFSALAFAIIIFGSAYIAEIVRGGFLSVPRGQREAATALGLRPWMVHWKVRLPLALRAIIPPLGNQFVWLMKATTIGIAIGFSDLFMIVSTSINQSGQTIELLLIMMTGFLIINYTISLAMNAINRAIAIPGYEIKK